MIRYVAALAIAVALVCTALAGEFNTKLSIGDPAPTFSNLEGTDGKKHSLSDFQNKDVVVLVITCNHCPVAIGYEERIIDFTKKYCTAPDSKVALIAINVNNREEDRLPKMTERAKEKGFNFPYLFDASQKIGRDLGATVTPEFFVYNKERKLVYMGSMDDNLKGATVNYLEPAVKAALKGEMPVKKETRGFGCTVEYGR